MDPCARVQITTRAPDAGERHLDHADGAFHDRLRADTTALACCRRSIAWAISGAKERRVSEIDDLDPAEATSQRSSAVS